VVSPLLANVYLHYVFDQWAEQWRRRQATGGMVLVRYADDFVAGFQHREDAQRFLAGLSERFARFGLELKAEKTRLIEFGRYAAQRRQERGLGKPETFDFLGFTHICGKTRDGKRFALKRKTSAKKMRAKLKEVKAELMRRMHLPIPEVGRWLQRVVRGHHLYYAVSGNLKAIHEFNDQVTRHWFQALRRRSQTDHTAWKRMNRLAEKWLPPPRVLHPYPAQRFAVRTQGKNRVR
jgi:hypothetical protein